ncbi:MAG: flagellar assembly protein FliW [Candidatus Schekmanbacteria bacterium]|nr:flagellar assembly protein FliW [Candidatus Schekmanbacteria bacterium]
MSSQPLLVQTHLFGPVAVDAESVIEIREGLLGFSHLRRYVLLERPESAPLFKWLQAVDDPYIAFMVMDPFVAFPEYDLSLSDDDADSLRLSAADDATVLTLVTIPENPREMTANLQAPLVANLRARLAKQIVLRDATFKTKHLLIERLLPAAKASSSRSAMA